MGSNKFKNMSTKRPKLKELDCDTLREFLEYKVKKRDGLKKRGSSKLNSFEQTKLKRLKRDINRLREMIEKKDC